MRLIGAIASAIVGLFGILMLLDEWADHAKRPAKWLARGRERRAFLTLAASVGFGMAAGSVAWLRARSAARVRNLLFDLEVLLAQLDGLVASALVHGSVKNSLGSIDVLVGLIGKYGFKAATLLTELERRLSDEEYDELKSGAMMITVGLDALQMPSAADQGPTVTSALTGMQTGIRRARSQARHLINERILE